MAITTYDELKTALANWSTRSDLTAYIDEFIDMAETWLKREPARPDVPEIGGIRSNISRTTGSLTSGTATLSLPSDYLDSYRLTITGDANYRELKFVEPTQLALRHKTGTGLPSYYTITDVIEFDVAPDSAYAYEFSYWPGIAALSSSNTTNWVITNYPDVYLSASMFHLSRFVKDEATAQTWLQQYKVSAWSASETYRSGRYSMGPVAIRVDMVTP